MRQRNSLIFVFLALTTARIAPACTTVLFNRNSAEQISVSAAPAIDERNIALKRFHINLGRNFAGLFSGANLQPLVIGGSSAAFSTAADEGLHDHFKDESDGVISETGATLGKPYVVAPATAGLLIWGHYSGNRRFRAFTYALAQAVTLSFAVTNTIKVATQRERPDQSNKHSFPSGHASDSFTIATVVCKYYGRKAGFMAYTVAGFVAFSRIKKDVHWASDVVAGATLGFIVGRTASAGAGVPEREPRMSWMPLFDPIHRGLGVTFAFRAP